MAEAADIALGERVLLDGRDVTDAIRAPAITEAASRVSADPGVRAALVRKQRALLQTGDWVAEGRDIGTVVCPEAEVKVFLTASPEVRARRRAEQIGEDYATVLADQAVRDRRDMEREHSPLVPAPDAVPVDTSDLDLDGVVGQIETLVVEVREIAGVKIAVVGYPNVGKSSLVNRLTSRARRSCTSARASRATARSSRRTGTGARSR